MTTRAKSHAAPPAALVRKRRKAAEVVAAELRHQIATGRLKPGDKLHPENVLQTEFEISRPTLREALRLLESESLITISPIDVLNEPLGKLRPVRNVRRHAQPAAPATAPRRTTR